jgi:hypothetical protein
MGKDTMSSEDNVTLPSEDAAAETAAPTSQTPAETAGASSSVEDLRAQVARMEAALKTANKEAAKQRRDAGELRAYKSETEAAKLSEQERREQALTDLQAKLATAETERQQERITSAIAIQAAQMGINPTLAARLVDPTDLEFDEAGKPTNVKDVLAQAVKEFGIQPAANGTARSTAGGATNPARSASNQAHIDREFVAKLTPQQYAGLTPAQKQEVQAVMQSSSKVRGH